MEGPLKELGKLEKLTTVGSTKSASVAESLDSLLSSLYDAKRHIEESGVDEDTLRRLARTVEAQKKEVDERQKEIYSSISRLGKALDKVCWNGAPNIVLYLIPPSRNSQRHYLPTRGSLNLPPPRMHFKKLSHCTSCVLANLM
jgi:hypothetical protein